MLAPQRGLFATVESKSKNKNKSPECYLHYRSTAKSKESVLPELSNFYCHPGRAGGSPSWISRETPMPLGMDSLFPSGHSLRWGCSIRFRSSIASKRVDRVNELPISSKPSVSPVEFNDLIRLDGRSFKNCASPCIVGACWQRKAKSVAYLHRRSRKQPASGLFTNNRRASLFSRANATIISAALAVCRLTRIVTRPWKGCFPSPSD